MANRVRRVVVKGFASLNCKVSGWGRAHGVYGSRIHLVGAPRSSKLVSFFFTRIRKIRK